MDVSPELLEMARKQAIQDERTRYIVENIYNIHFSKTEKRLRDVCNRDNLPESSIGNLGPSYSSAAKTLVQKGYLHIRRENFFWANQIFRDFLIDLEQFEEELDFFEIEKLFLLCDAHILIDVEEHKILVHGKQVDVTQSEFELLEICIKGGKLSSRDKLFIILPGESTVETTTMPNCQAISRLRRIW